MKEIQEQKKTFQIQIFPQNCQAGVRFGVGNVNFQKLGEFSWFGIENQDFVEPTIQRDLKLLEQTKNERQKLAAHLIRRGRIVPWQFLESGQRKRGCDYLDFHQEQAFSALNYRKNKSIDFKFLFLILQKINQLPILSLILERNICTSFTEIN